MVRYSWTDKKIINIDCTWLRNAISGVQGPVQDLLNSFSPTHVSLAFCYILSSSRQRVQFLWVLDILFFNVNHFTTLTGILFGLMTYKSYRPFDNEPEQWDANFYYATTRFFFFRLGKVVFSIYCLHGGKKKKITTSPSTATIFPFVTSRICVCTTSDWLTTVRLGRCLRTHIIHTDPPWRDWLTWRRYVISFRQSFRAPLLRGRCSKTARGYYDNNNNIIIAINTRPKTAAMVVPGDLLE